MAGRADVEAGRAFVRLFLKNDMSKALAKALKSAGDSVQSFGEGAMKAGAAVTAAGTAITAPLIASVKAFTSMGGEAMDAAARTGLSVEALSELGFAAQQTGASLDDVETAMKKAAKSGLAKAGETAEQTFTRLAGEIAAIEDPMHRAAKAQEYFGRSGTKLLPMISDLDALRKRARELGIVMSTEDAAAADELGDAFDEVGGQIKAMAFQVGKALAGPLKEYVAQASAVASRTIEWIKANGETIRTVAMVGVAVLGIGAAITAIGGAAYAAGIALSGLGAIVGSIGAVAGFLVSPFGLATAAIVGGITALVRWTESGQAALQWLVNAVMPMVETIKSAFGGIVMAIQNGNWSDALAIAFAGLKIVAAQGLDALKGLVGESLGNIVGLLGSSDFAGAWGQAINGLSLVWESFAKGIVDTFTGAADIIMQTWLKATSWITDKIFDLAKQEGPIGDAMAKILGVDLRKMNEANKRRAFEAKRQSISLMEDQLKEAESTGDTAKADDLRTRIQTARDQLGAGIYGAPETGDPFAASKEAARQQLEGQIAGARAALQQARDDAAARQGAAAGAFVGGNHQASQGLSEAARKAQEELDSLLAKQGADAVARLQREKEDALATKRAQSGATPIPGLSMPQSSVGIGPTFSAAAAQAAGQMGSGGPQEKALGYFQQMTKDLRELGILTKTQTATAQETQALYTRFLAAFTHG